MSPMQAAEDYFTLHGDVMHPKTACRGCAGLGIGIQVNPRTMQVIGDVQGYQWRFTHPTETQRVRFFRITPIVYDQLLQQGVFYGPLAAVRSKLFTLERAGWEYDPWSIAIDPGWECPECDGLGQRGLFLGTLHKAMEISSDASDAHNDGRRV